MIDESGVAGVGDNGRMVRRFLVTMLGITVLVLGSASSCSSILGTDDEPSSAPSPSASPSEAAPRPSETVIDNPLGPLTGTWLGVWHNQVPETYGTFTLSWAQQDDKVFGVITVVGSNCFESGGGDVEGTVNGSDIEFGAIESETRFSYAGRVEADGALSGTYTSNCGTAAGTWEAYRES